MPTPSEKQAIEAILMMKPSLYQRRCEFLAKARHVRLSGLAKKKTMIQNRADAVRKAATLKKVTSSFGDLFK